MKFKLPRQEIAENLNKLIQIKIRKNRIYVPRIAKRNLQEIKAVSKEIQEIGLPQHLILKKLKNNLGHGIFLHPQAEPILKGEVIAPYAGEVALFPQNAHNDSDYVFSLVSDLHLTREEQKIWDPKNRYHPKRLYAVDLDAQKKGNFTRFINHSEKPNVEAEFFRIPASATSLGAPTFEVIYVAKKKIRPGEQLLVCYEGDDKSYWGACGIKPVPITPQTFRLNDRLELVEKSH